MTALFCPSCKLSNQQHIDAGNWLKCNLCGHKWRSNDSFQQHASYYTQQIGRNNFPRQYTDLKFSSRLSFLLPYINNNCRIIEIGCAEGELGRLVKTKRQVVYDGLELSQDANQAKQVLDQVFLSAQELAAYQHKYDLILSFHVLEHITDIDQELEFWFSLLQDNGKLIVEVPNQSGHSLVINDNNAEHVHQFTLQSLICCLNKYGFETILATTGNFESPVYNNSIRIVAEKALSDTQKSVQLVDRINHAFQDSFILYGIGGDFYNYIYPIVDSLAVFDLIDSSSGKWGQNIAGKLVKQFDHDIHANKPVLVTTVRYETEVVVHLLGLGVRKSQIKTLGEIYGAL
jgi:SAM-dependent methyltransferase